VSDLAQKADPGLTRAEVRTVEVTTEADVEVLRVAARDPSPARAARRANAYASAVVTFVEDQQAAERSADVRRLEDRIATLQPAPNTRTPAAAPDAELQALQTKLADRLARTDDAVRILEPAVPSGDPVSPKPMRDGVLAGFAVLAIGLAVVYARSASSSRFTTAEEVARVLELPALGEIPKGRAAGAVVEEAFRLLRTSIDFGLRSTDHPVVLVTSSEPRSGKTHVVANLGRSFAADGRRVVLVDSDVRRPTLHQRVGIPLEPGLGELLSADRPGTVELQVSEVPMRSRARRGGVLDVAAAGGGVADPAEALASPRMEHALRALRRDYELVVLDSPPLLGVADALVLARYVDAVVLVVDSRRDRRRKTQRALEMLQSVDAPVLGFVFNGGRPAGGVYGSYGNRAALRAEPRSAPARPRRASGS
jgi:capsular exopolysaccharide synthesis family protein